ncbi:MAG: 16S rRNA (guanine(966)-N(2))-methyltransferase RsmD [Ruminococcaceae bacterium]|nr:16S rRNA (guanine(966)-N(2))-methyltransferase RsmD [Oscillospiraceae bacterium]
MVIIMMRIITGKARGVKLDTLEGLATRPTAEKVKEAIFSAIQFEIEGRRVLDLFAGSGQLALEALSRGASEAVLVDASKEAAEIIRRNAVKTKLFPSTKVIVNDYKTAIKQLSGREKFDIIFCDAPYAAKLTGDAIEKVLKGGLLSDGGIMICETDEDKTYETEGFALRKHTHYGRVFVSIYEKTVNSESEILI